MYDLVKRAVYDDDAAIEISKMFQKLRVFFNPVPVIGNKFVESIWNSFTDNTTRSSVKTTITAVVNLDVLWRPI